MRPSKIIIDHTSSQSRRSICSQVGVYSLREPYGSKFHISKYVIEVMKF